MTTRRALSLAAGLALAATLSTLPALRAAEWREVLFGADVTVDGKVVPAGSYTLKWRTDDGGEVRITVTNGRQVVGGVSGRWADLETTPEVDSVAYRVDGDGRREMVEIRFGGKSRVIRIDPPVVQSARAE
jgi:hypothetical protein